MSGEADAEDKGFEQFERFLEHWSRRDFLKRTGGATAYMAFAAGGLSFLEACGGSTQTSQTPKKGGHVIEGNFSDIRTLNSMLSSDTASNQVIGLMFDGLMNYSKNGDLVPALAKSMPVTSSDGLTYKFTLRDNLKFSDGQPLTADDVVFTYQLAYDAKYKDVSSPRRGDLQKYIASVTAPDLKTGEIDIGPVDPSQFDNVKTATNVAMSEFPVPTFTFYAYNLDPTKLGGQLFGDKAVRQALLYALNRQQIVSAVFFGHGSVANSVEPPTSWAYKDKPQVLIGFDKAKAESLLDSAGWAKGSDGIRAKGGQKLKFTMITNAGNKQRESMLTVMQQSWKDIGVDATPSLIQFPQLVSQIVSIRTFDMFLVGFNWGIDPDEAPLFHSRNTAPGGFNGADFKNSQVDSILDQALVTLDRNTRKQLYGQFQDIMSDEVPSPILLFNSGIWGVSTRVQGTDFGPFNQFAARPWNSKVWVTDGK